MARRRERRGDGGPDDAKIVRDQGIDWSVVFAQGEKPETPASKPADAKRPAAQDADHQDQGKADTAPGGKSTIPRNPVAKKTPGSSAGSRPTPDAGHDWNSVFHASAQLDNEPPAARATTPPAPKSATAVPPVPKSPTAKTQPPKLPTPKSPTPKSAAERPPANGGPQLPAWLAGTSASLGADETDAPPRQAPRPVPQQEPVAIVPIGDDGHPLAAVGMSDSADTTLGEVHTIEFAPDPALPVDPIAGTVPPPRLAPDGRTVIFEDTDLTERVSPDSVETGDPWTEPEPPTDVPTRPTSTFSASVDNLVIPSEPAAAPAPEAPATASPDYDTLGLPGNLFNDNDSPTSDRTATADPSTSVEGVDIAAVKDSGRGDVPGLVQKRGTPWRNPTEAGAPSAWLGAMLDSSTDRAAVSTEPEPVAPTALDSTTSSDTTVNDAATSDLANHAAAMAESAPAEPAAPTTAEARPKPPSDRFGRLELRQPKDDLELLMVRSELVGVFGAPPVRCEVNLCPPDTQLDVLTIHFDEIEWTPDDADIVWDFMYDWLPKVWLILCGRPRLVGSVVETWVSYKAADLPGEQYLRTIATLGGSLGFDDFSRIHRDAVERRTGGRWFDGVEVSSDY